ncbi:hypothetical protein AKO1_015621 [Acrasis kona]|uniref:NADP-dependent oxidoreductase domain-containing protein n=1 Tax=Acrasis kona TaxID=1008807 RepID=A0AAW2ZF90_9EUKA
MLNVRSLSKLNFLRFNVRQYAAGKATSEGTQRYYLDKLQMFAENAITRTPSVSKRSNWTIGRVGFDSTQVSNNNKNYQVALQFALQSGCNVVHIDPNNVIGQELCAVVLNGMIEENVLKRDEIIITSQVGYHEPTGRDSINIVHFDPTKDHSIAPSSIKDQLALLKELLHMDTIDILYLTDPEIQYADDDDDATFSNKIEEAFSYMEQLVQEGQIQRYGIHSRFLPDQSRRKFTLKQYLDVAIKAGGEDHHFEYISFPYNFVEKQPYQHRAYNGSTDNLFQNAQHYNISTIGHRPLHAILPGGKSVKFVDVRVENDTHSFEPTLQDPNQETALNVFMDSMNETIRYEQTLPDADDFPTDIAKGENHKLPHIGALRWGMILSGNLSRLDTLHTFENVLENRIRPELHYAHEKLRKSQMGKKYSQWLVQYNYLCTKMIRDYTTLLKEKHLFEVRNAKKHVDELCPELIGSETMSKKVMRTLLSSGVDCVLTDPRHESQIDDLVVSIGEHVSEKGVKDLMEKAEWRTINFEESDEPMEGQPRRSLDNDEDL